MAEFATSARPAGARARRCNGQDGAQLRPARVVASLVPRIRRHLPIAAALLSLAAIHTAPAFASTTQEAIFQDDTQLKANPVATMQTLRDLGVDRVRVNIAWNEIAPSPNSTKR